jgi:hypothetical protein
MLNGFDLQNLELDKAGLVGAEASREDSRQSLA